MVHLDIVLFSPSICWGGVVRSYLGAVRRQWDGSNGNSKRLPVLEFLGVLLPNFGD